MKHFKISAMAVAVFAIAATFALHANAIGKRTITACFRALDLQDAGGTLFYSPALSDSKTTVEAAIIGNSIRYLETTPSTITTGGTTNSNYFNCVKLTETLESLPNVSQFTIGGITAKWMVVEILYKPTAN